MRAAWIFLCRSAFFIFLRCHLYRIKSNAYRYLFEQKYRSYLVAAYESISDLVTALSKLKWTGDGWKQGWDAISYPETVEYVLHHPMSEAAKNIDCDEFAVYAANAILSSQYVGWLAFYQEPKILTVTWVEKNWKPGGHNVCLFRCNGKGRYRYGYMDYGMPRYYSSLEDVVAGVIARYPGKEATCAGWAVSDPVTLRPLEVHWS